MSTFICVVCVDVHCFLTPNVITWRRFAFGNVLNFRFKALFLPASSTFGMSRRHFFLECCLSKSFSHNATMHCCQCVYAPVLIGASVAKISLLLISSIKPSANPVLRPVDPEPLQITKMNSTVFSAIFMVFLMASPLQAAPETQVSSA